MFNNHFEFQNQTDSNLVRKKTLQSQAKEEWEESLVQDSSEEPKVVKPLFNKSRLCWLYFLFIGVIFILFSYTFYLQVVVYAQLKEMAEENRIRILIKRAPRGVIYDRSGNLLVHNVPSFDVLIIPADLPKNDELKNIVQFLSVNLEIPLQELDSQINNLDFSSYQSVLIKRNIKRDKALLLEMEINELPGVVIEKNPIREYKDAEYFAHILGYTGKVNKDDLKSEKDYLFNDYIGKEGLELFYEDILRGKPGREQVEVNSLGKIESVLALEDPQAGDNLVLSIDQELQKKMMSALSDIMKQMRNKKGVVIAINPQNGQILGLVSLPSYDNNLFARGIKEEEYKKFVDDPDQPLFNRAISGTYPPGSTIKPVMASAALEEGVVNKNTIINDTGVISVVNQYNPDVVYHFRGWNSGGLGPMNVISALAKSSDIYFYIVGGGYEGFKGLGAEKIAEYFKKFGLGSLLGIDLPGEVAGLIPTPEWKKKTKNESWYLGDIYHMAIGQGDVLTTPLQVLSWTATIANGGTLYKPYLVTQIINAQNNTKQNIEPSILNENFISPGNIEIIRQGMREAVLSGSAKGLSSLSVPVAGKTGTAEIGQDDKTHAWFTCFAPYNNPEIALVVLVEGGGEGHKTAIPVAKEILEWYFSNRENTRS